MEYGHMTLNHIYLCIMVKVFVKLSGQLKKRHIKKIKNKHFDRF